MIIERLILIRDVPSGAIVPSVCLASEGQPIPKVSFIDNEPEFRWSLLEDQMAFDKLHEGIKKFAEDGQTLKDLLKKKLSA